VGAARQSRQAPSHQICRKIGAQGRHDRQNPGRGAGAGRLPRPFGQDKSLPRTPVLSSVRSRWVETGMMCRGYRRRGGAPPTKRTFASEITSPPDLPSPHATPWGNTPGSVASAATNSIPIDSRPNRRPPWPVLGCVSGHPRTMRRNSAAGVIGC
jgi:hypothetical protein